MGKYHAHQPKALSEDLFEYKIEVSNLTVKMGYSGLELTTKNRIGSSFIEVSLPVSTVRLEDLKTLADNLLIVIALAGAFLIISLLLPYLFQFFQSIYDKVMKFEGSVFFYILWVLYPWVVPLVLSGFIGAVIGGALSVLVNWLLSLDHYYVTMVLAAFMGLSFMLTKRVRVLAWLVLLNIVFRMFNFVTVVTSITTVMDSLGGSVIQNSMEIYSTL